MADPGRPIRRSRQDALLGGVCAGLASWAGWDPSVVRVLFVVVTAFTGFVFGAVAYGVLWALLPLEEPLARA